MPGSRAGDEISPAPNESSRQSASARVFVQVDPGSVAIICFYMLFTITYRYTYLCVFQYPVTENDAWKPKVMHGSFFSLPCARNGHAIDN